MMFSSQSIQYMKVKTFVEIIGWRSGINNRVAQRYKNHLNLCERIPFDM